MQSQIKWHSFPQTSHLKQNAFVQLVQQARVVRTQWLTKRIGRLCCVIVLKSAGILGVSLSGQCFLWQERQAQGTVERTFFLKKRAEKQREGKEKLTWFLNPNCLDMTPSSWTLLRRTTWPFQQAECSSKALQFHLPVLGVIYTIHW